MSAFQIGSMVKVWQVLKSIGTFGIDIEAGWKCNIKYISDDGNALLQFESPFLVLWIRTSGLSKLKVCNSNLDTTEKN